MSALCIVILFSATSCKEKDKEQVEPTVIELPLLKSVAIGEDKLMEYSYNSLDQLETIKRTESGFIETKTLKYDEEGRLIEMHIAEPNKEYTYEYVYSGDSVYYITQHDDKYISHFDPKTGRITKESVYLLNDFTKEYELKSVYNYSYNNGDCVGYTNEWIKVYCENIYFTTNNPFKKIPDLLKDYDLEISRQMLFSDHLMSESKLYTTQSRNKLQEHWIYKYEFNEKGYPVKLYFENGVDTSILTYYE